jgi:hypothetical protein
MENLLKNKRFISVYLVWIVIHSFLLLKNLGDGYTSKGDRFWPFSTDNLDYYDISEWFVYVVSPLVIIFIIKAYNNHEK